MPSLFPCPEFQRDCECEPFPVRNFSVEAADQNHCFSNYTAPPVVGTFFEPSCFVQCTEVIIGTAAECEELVEECAARAGVDCVGNPPVVPPGTDPPNGPFFPGRTIYQNSFQSCTVTCPDGTQFSASVAAGTIHSLWQSDADARAYALACKRATAKRVCFITDATLDSICADVAGTVTFDVFGGTAPYTYAHTGGTLPTGMTLDGNGILFGTPTTGGSYTFEVTVTDAVGSTQVKEFTIKIVQITSPTALPNATQYASYTYTLLNAGTTGTTSWVHVSDSFPTGLLLDLATGVLSSDVGGITDSGDFSFTLRIKDGSGVECDKAFTLHVSAGIGLMSYWRCEDVAGDLQDSTPNNLDLSSDIYASVAGKVNQGVNVADGSSFFALPYNALLPDPNVGFTFCGWMKLSDEGAGTIWIAQCLNGHFVSLSFEDVTSQTILFRHNVFSMDIEIPYPLDGGWHFIRTWYDGTRLNLQLDNGVIFQGAASALAVSPMVGFQLAGNGTFLGSGSARTYDEVGLWARSLSNTEAANLYNSGSGITYGNPNMPP